MTPSTKPAAPRVLWIDASRAVAVLAVLLLHFQMWIIEPYDTDPGMVTQAWAAFSGFMEPIRMPLLFLVSGILASSALRKRPLRVGMHRVVSSVYLVVVWTTLYFVIRLLIGQPLPGAAVDVSQYIKNLYTPNSVLWFVYVLGAWSFLVILLRRAPRWVGFSVFAVVLPLLLEADLGLPNRIIIYGTFFAAGVYFKDWFLAFFTDRVGLKAILLPVFAVAAGFLAVATESIPVLSFYTWTLQHFLAAMATIALVSIACRWSVFARAFGWLGQRTLQMFILHQPAAWLVMTVPVLHTILMADAIRWIWPVTGMIFLAAVSLGAYALLSRTPLKYLFRLPKFPPAKSIAVPVPAREQSSIA